MMKRLFFRGENCWPRDPPSDAQITNQEPQGEIGTLKTVASVLLTALVCVIPTKSYSEEPKIIEVIWDGDVGFRNFLIFVQKFGLDSEGDIGFRDFLIFAQSYGRWKEEE